MLFEEIISQNIVKKILENSLKKNSLSHAYIFSGQEGVGKKTIAMILSKSLNCENTLFGFCNKCYHCLSIEKNMHPDVIRIEEKDIIKIDVIRKIKKELGFKPFIAKKKVCIILESEKMNESAQNCLLKTLEEPSGDSILILTTTNISMLLPTIISRSCVLKFSPLPILEMEKLLIQKHDISFSQSHLVSMLSFGNMKLSLDLLNSEKIKIRNENINLFLNILNSNEIFLLEKIEQICKEKEEVNFLLDSILWWFRDLILLKKNVDNKYLINLETKNSLLENINLFSFSKIENIIDLIFEIKEDIKNNINLRLILEVLFLNIRSMKYV